MEETMTVVQATSENIAVDNLTPASRPSYRGKPLPWDIIGKNFNGKDVSIREAIEEAGADYTVASQPVIRVTPEIIQSLREGNHPTVTLDPTSIVPGYKATYREDNGYSLGVVTDKYGIVQNGKAFDVLNLLEEVSGIKPVIDNVGVFDGGARIYVACRFGDDYDLGGGDIIKNYVVFTNTHDGSGSVMCFFTPIRVWCKNTLNVAIRKTKNKLAYPHTSNANNRLDFTDEKNRLYATQILQESITYGQQFREAMERMKSQTVTAQEVNDFAARLYLNDQAFKMYVENGYKLEGAAPIATISKNNVRGLIDAIENGVGQEAHRGTRLWLFNGITTYLHNEKMYASPETEFKATMDGSVKQKVQKAFELLTV